MLDPVPSKLGKFPFPSGPISYVNYYSLRRENPNDRSAKEIQHLGPATDFYKRLALDCSGQQIAVDLFLMNSQYSDLATLCEYT